MKNGPTTRANSFLIEMIIVLLFFSISISVTLGLFVEAHNNSISSREKNHAMILAQNVVEQVHSGDTSLNFIEGANITTDDNEISCTVMYDDEWQITASAYYTMEVTVMDEGMTSGSMRKVDISISKKTSSDAEQLYALSSNKYIPKF